MRNAVGIPSLVCLASVFLTSTALAGSPGGTPVSDTVLTQTWDAAHSPYLVTGTITVPSGNTLTIGPGVDVLFDADVQFRVNGVLHAVGTPQDSIRFLPDTVAQWRGLRFSGGDSSTVAYARISGGNARSGAGSGSANGGGVWVNDSGTRVRLDHVVIAGNQAVTYGGALYVASAASVWLSHCDIWDNNALLGGGIHSYGGVIDVSYSVFRADSGSNAGGAMYLWVNAGPNAIRNCTFYGNHGGGSGGGGLYDAGVTVTVTNSVFWGNTWQQIVKGDLATVTYCDVQQASGTYTGTGNISGDPLFVNASAGDFHLQASSPCIDAGDPVSPLDPDGTRTDMGAFFYDQATYVDGTITTQTWHETNSPYRVTGTITVPSGNTLTIESGVDVLFDADVQFVVNGALHAVGTPQDSIRFVKGAAEEWGGIRITGGGPDTFAYVRISDAHGDGVSPAYDGGAMFVDAPGVVAELANVVMSGNTADHDAGGLMIYTGTVTMSDCAVRDNTAMFGAGLCLYGASAVVSLSHTVIADNTASGLPGQEGGGGGVFLNVQSSGTFTNCTIAGNTTDIGAGSGIFVTNNAAAHFHNSVVWGNNPGGTDVATSGASLSAEYSDLPGGYTGTGNISGDPLFADAANGDYHLRSASPCIDAGDPASPLDPDGTRADMGAFAFTHTSGTITSTTWAKANSPYRIGGTITVPSGNTLTIEPGVDVLFDADVTLAVEGRLLAVGTETDSVRFLAGIAPEWGRILISGGDSSAFAYSRISGAHADEATTGGNIGGGLNVSGGGTHVSLSNCVVSGNTSDARGGGIYVDNSASLFADRASIVHNAAAGGDGGGLFIGSECLGQISNCTISSNTAGGHGGGAYLIYCGVVSFDHCVVSENSAGGAGTQGGGVWNYGADLTIRNCTFYGNSATGEGGGYYVYWVEAPAPVENSIFWANAPDQIAIRSGDVAASYCDIAGDIPWAGTGNINADPLFVDATNGDYHLQAGSPCIDAGDPISPLDPDGTRADMGAFPYTHVQAPTDVQGTVTTRTWDHWGSPYHVLGTVTVPSGNTLTIEPGVDVLFDADVQFIVQGSLYAVGTETDSIHFLKGTAPKWGGLKFVGGDTTTIYYARISDGHAEGSDPYNLGGGIYLSGSGTRLGLAHAIVSGNRADSSGGGIALREGAHATLANCTISANSASSSGGLLVYGTATLANCTISGNTANYNGGGLLVYGTATLTSCTVSGNSSSYGGGLCVSGTATLANCTLSGNTANYGGGGLYVSGTATLANCTVSGNTANNYGGGLLVHGTATLTGCTVSGNTANNYGGGLSVYGTATLANCTLSGNTTPNYGAAFFVYSDATGTLLNSILWGNSPDEIRADGPTTVTYSDVQGGFTGVGNMDADPLFSTHPDSAYHLTGSSPCIDAGDPASPLDPDGTRTDMGAYYYRGLYGDVSRDGTIAAYDASLILRSLVGLIAEVLEFYADVSGNGFTSAYDAHLILRKAMDPTFVFPVEGGKLPKAAAHVFRMLTWVPDDDGLGLALVIDDPSELVAGQVTLVLSGDAPVRVNGGDLIESNQEGRTLRVAFVRSVGDGSVLLRLHADVPFRFEPQVLKSEFNEGRIVVSHVNRAVAFALEQNAPNPFNPTTTIKFTMPSSGIVNLAIYDVNGRLVRTLVEGSVEAGAHEVVWEGTDASGREVSSGMYLYRLTSEQGNIVRRMVLVR